MKLSTLQGATVHPTKHGAQLACGLTRNESQAHLTRPLPSRSAGRFKGAYWPLSTAAMTS